MSIMIVADHNTPRIHNQARTVVLHHLALTNRLLPILHPGVSWSLNGLIPRRPANLEVISNVRVSTLSCLNPSSCKVALTPD
jgi:hypothetical protein